MRFAGFPNRRPDPANGGDDHVHDRAQHEYMKRAEPITQPGEDQAEDAVAHGEDEPGDEAGCQQMARPPRESKNGNRREKAERHCRGDIPFQRNVLQYRDAIGKNEPDGED